MMLATVPLTSSQTFTGLLRDMMRPNGCERLAELRAQFHVERLDSPAPWPKREAIGVKACRVPLARSTLISGY